ncbi:hypothetical protein BBF96_11140 [Anoxybacter fermentans]|uniref:DUF8042 domain-containing protein n=1 Tax=Anoxybacter fermentans TaxID=1323375 RepID=A0A3Q9HRB5_9FIRM|nr:hypothetical protein [Anoxybacter fermentans]AZR73894.1 hypothetical protein BBF96_11140 [Anoxybacter fermentans]
MKVFVNGELYKAIRSIEMLHEVLEDLRIECKKENKILQLKIDGKYVNEILPGQTEEDIDLIEIEIRSPVELVIEGLIEGINYLPRLLEGLNESSLSFREGKQNKGIKLFEQSIDGLNWVNHILVGLDVYILSMDQFQKNSGNYHEDKAGFEQIIKELMTAWENEDYVLISDLIEYELIPNLEKWNQHFMQILDQLAGV